MLGNGYLRSVGGNGNTLSPGQLGAVIAAYDAIARDNDAIAAVAEDDCGEVGYEICDVASELYPEFRGANGLLTDAVRDQIWDSARRYTARLRRELDK